MTSTRGCSQTDPIVGGRFAAAAAAAVVGSRTMASLSSSDEDRKLDRKSDSCWQPTVSSKSWKGIELLLFWYCRSTKQARANG